jgi:hypothetical protein
MLNLIQHPFRWPRRLWAVNHAEWMPGQARHDGFSG